MAFAPFPPPLATSQQTHLHVAVVRRLWRHQSMAGSLGTVTGKDLRLGQFHQHLCGRLGHGQLIQYGGPVVCDDDFTVRLRYLHQPCA